MPSRSPSHPLKRSIEATGGLLSSDDEISTCVKARKRDLPAAKATPTMIKPIDLPLCEDKAISSDEDEQPPTPAPACENNSPSKALVRARLEAAQELARANRTDESLNWLVRLAAEPSPSPPAHPVVLKRPPRTTRTTIHDWFLPRARHAQYDESDELQGATCAGETFTRAELMLLTSF